MCHGKTYDAVVLVEVDSKELSGGENSGEVVLEDNLCNLIEPVQDLYTVCYRKFPTKSKILYILSATDFSEWSTHVIPSVRISFSFKRNAIISRPLPS
jgi:hypothetical protein